MLNLFYIVKCFFSSLQVLTFYVVRTNCRAGRRKSGFESLFVNLVQLYGISKLSTVNRECCNVTALNIKGMALLWHLGLLEQEMFKDCWNSFSTFLSLLLTMMLTIFFFFQILKMNIIVYKYFCMVQHPCMHFEYLTWSTCTKICAGQIVCTVF